MDSLLKKALKKTPFTGRGRKKSGWDEPAKKDGVRLLEEKSESVKGVFVHVHKCGGSSLLRAFEGDPHVVCCCSLSGNLPGRTGRDLIPEGVWNDSFKFSFVRNPYSRVLSAYRMFSRGHLWSEVFPNFDQFIEFLQWVDLNGHTVLDGMELSAYRRTLDNVLHHCSSFSNPKYHLSDVDFVGKLENFSDDLLVVGSRIGVDVGKIPHLKNSSNGVGYKEFYNERTKKIVTEIYASDLEKYKYKFE